MYRLRTRSSNVHVVLEYHKQIDLALADAKLVLDVVPGRCATPLYFDMAPLLAVFPAPGERQYYSALQFRLQMEQKNAQNAAQRLDWTIMTARTEAYTAIVTIVVRRTRRSSATKWLTASERSERSYSLGSGARAIYTGVSTSRVV